MYSLTLYHPETGEFLGFWEYVKNTDAIYNLIIENYPEKYHFPRSIVRNLASPAAIEQKPCIRERSKYCQIKKIDGNLVRMGTKSFLVKNQVSTPISC